MFSIRKGQEDDLPQVLELVKELATFEKAPEEVVNTTEKMIGEGFGNRPYFEFFIAEEHEQIIGLALYFFSYSTWKGKSLYLDDIIVTETSRGKGIGKALFKKVAEVAKDENCGKMHWQVLDWNEPAIDYYKKLGASFDREWINCALTSEQLKNY